MPKKFLQVLDSMKPGENYSISRSVLEKDKMGSQTYLRNPCFISDLLWYAVCLTLQKLKEHVPQYSDIGNVIA